MNKEIEQKSIPRAKWGSPDKPLRIGNVEIPCYVLDDGRRVLSGRGMQAALDLGQSHGTKLRHFLGLKVFKDLISEELAMGINNPIRFIRPGRGGILATGWEAKLLSDICDVVVAADDAGLLNTEDQKRTAQQCRILRRAFAKIGINALVDEITGYRAVTSKEDIRRILALYVRPEFLPWTSAFPEEFYVQMFRLRGLEYDPSSLKRPWVFAKDTVDMVYRRLPPGVYENLARLSPKDTKGNRRHKLHQFLTSDIGRPHLEKHLSAVMAIQRLSPNWRRFEANMDRAFPVNNQLSFAMDDDIFILPEEERKLQLKEGRHETNQ